MKKYPGQQGKKFCIVGKKTPMLPYFEEKRSEFCDILDYGFRLP
jgi:hypothetical protein